MPIPTTVEYSRVRVFARDGPQESSSAPDGQGCIQCPSALPACPKCASNEQCQTQIQTCHSCPTTFCTRIEGSSSKSTPVGGIVGGVIGALVVLGLIGGFLYYKYVYRKKHPVLLGDDDVMMEKAGRGDDSSEFGVQTDTDIHSTAGTDTSGSGSRGNDSAPSQRKTATNAYNRRRLSSYESFTRPKTRYAKGEGRNKETAQRRARQKMIVAQANASSGIPNEIYLDRTNRNSVATSISTTNASNILPIAYIPGVTVRPTKNNTRSIYSYETNSIFSDLDTIENASIIGDVMRANNHSQNTTYMSTAGAVAGEKKPGTMTAIKAQPRLVNVDKIEEEEEDEDDDITDEDDEDDGDDHKDKGLDGYTYTSSVHSTTSDFHPTTNAVLTNTSFVIQENDETDDSDVDSDIGEITRATSVRKPAQQPDSVRQDREILLDIGRDGEHHPEEIPLEILHLEPRSHESVATGAGSIMLNVEIDEPPAIQPRAPARPAPARSISSGERSPFEDPE
ncbi:uncharacterized protein CANTADRAFT_4940 [Suhomyces tanzawaensis NRRL Y-17324]|uniref:Membrane anchor Opy2 N-terminal domain-containing protein n=1 Tax=Suhomyces tanzawaensis NRRL Y-17324 TaxID=984487 RepID=A0A1E4SN62_9ASCO|nr:uncharacterized protein CANTADRAFT_4940 [Suhomyces tanzawaensis NRRL Y-17324]ODV80953.1 hypothetical protein CANTADRAFT_4940 [Suhomyces tanzawaensis NRRL Y-17324]